MNVNARTADETAPAPGEVVFRIRLEDADGEPLKHFVPGGPVELWLMASERPKNASGRDGLRYVMLPLAFPNFPVGRVHAEGIRHALGALERALERAQAAAGTPIPTRDDGHYHVVRFARYSRALPWVAMCEVCMAELESDVPKWAAARGLIEPGERLMFGESATILGAFEKAINRVGEEVDLG